MSNLAELRCEITGNPCGTDTWQKHRPCKCDACQRYLCESLTEAQKREREARAELDKCYEDIAGMGDLAERAEKAEQARDDALQEVERLKRDRLEVAGQQLDSAVDRVRLLAEDNEKLRADVKRLRGLLKRATLYLKDWVDEHDGDAAKESNRDRFRKQTEQFIEVIDEPETSG